MTARASHAALTLVLTALLSTPWLVAWARTPPGHVYTGHLAGGGDYGSYLSKIRQGWEGQWSWQNRMSPSDAGRRPLFLFYLALGHLARAAGIPPEGIPVVFHGAATALMAAALGAVLALARRAVGDDGDQGRALWLAVAASSPWALVLALSRAEYYPATHLYMGILFPHYLIDVAGIAWSMALLSDQVREPRRWRPAAGAAAMAAVSLVHPHVAGAALAAMGLFVASMPPEGRRRGLPFLVLAGLAALPYTAYVGWLWATDPAVAAWRAQANAGPVPVWRLPVLFGPASLLALWEGPRAWREGGAARMAACWAAAAALLPQLRVLGASGEFAMGMSVPVGILAGRAIPRLPARLRTPAFLLSQVGFVLAMAALLSSALQPGGPDPRLHIPPDRAAAMRLAAALAGDTPILAPPHLATQMVWLTGSRMVWGHDVETPDSGRVYRTARDLYEGRLGEGEARAFLAESGARVVVADGNHGWPIRSGEDPWKPGLTGRYRFLQPVGKDGGIVVFVARE